MSAIRVQEILDQATEIYATLKTHKRYTLRLTAIISIAIGSVFNFASFVCAFVGFSSGDAPRYLTVWASVVVGYSTSICYEKSRRHRLTVCDMSSSGYRFYGIA